MRRRGAGALLEKLWELPGGEKTARESIETFLRRHLEALGTALPRRRKLGVVRHAITHRRILAPVFLYELSGQAPFALPRADWRWVDPARLDIQATSSMTAKACRFLDPQ